ncbi:hypothetical protein [Streptomyces sp. D2-8]
MDRVEGAHGPGTLDIVVVPHFPSLTGPG